jgi:hypothetical protein
MKTKKLIWVIINILGLVLSAHMALATTWNVTIVDCAGTNCSNAFQPHMLGTAGNHPMTSYL